MISARPMIGVFAGVLLGIAVIVLAGSGAALFGAQTSSPYSQLNATTKNLPGGTNATSATNAPSHLISHIPDLVKQPAPQAVIVFLPVIVALVLGLALYVAVKKRQV
jgi:hypothetical protein